MHQSKIHNLSDKQLVFAALRLMKSTFDYTNPYEEAAKSLDEVEEVLRYFNIESTFLDVEFMAKFIKLNEEKLIELQKNNKINIQGMTFKRPIPEKFEIYYEVYGPATFTEKYKTFRTSYDGEWAKSGIVEQYNEGNFNYYEGQYLEHEVDNWDVDSFIVDFYQKVKEYNINSLKKDTLMELRNLIDRRLKNL